MLKITFTEQQKNNLMIFLDRVPLKGLKEVQAINEILNALNRIAKEESERST